MRRHYDWSGKNCPRILNYNNWQGWIEFKSLVKIELEGGIDMVTEERVKEIVKEEIELAIKPSIEKGSPDSHWTNDNFVNLNARGIEITERRYDDLITRGEIFALLARLTEPKTLIGLIEHARDNV